MNEREIIETLLMSETFVDLSRSVAMTTPINDKDELETMLALSSIEVLKHMDAENIGFRTEDAQKHFVSLMAIVFSLLFDGTENFANATGNYGQSVSIN